MSNSDTFSIRPDEATLQKREAITQAMEEYIAGNPEHRGFTFFLPSSQDIQLIKHVAATMSLKIGKPIAVVYPYEGIQTSRRNHPMRENDPSRCKAVSIDEPEHRKDVFSRGRLFLTGS